MANNNVDVVPVVVDGLALNQVFLRDVLSANPIYGKLIAHGMGLTTGEQDMRLLAYICHLRAYYDNKRTARDVGKTLLMGELFTTSSLHPRLSAIEAAGVIRALVENIRAEGTHVGSNHEYVAPDAANELTYELCKTYISNAAAATTLAPLGTVTMAVNALVAYAKKGTVSDNLVEKLTESLKTSISKTCALNGNDISNFYQQYGRGITEANAAGFFTQIQTMIPGECLPIVTLLNQVAYTGLTAAMVIKDALRKYPTFPWAPLTALFPEEILACTAAINQARANPYIGFKTNLGDIASTKYKNVAWVAKEVLVRYDGQSALRNYGGWAKVPKEKAKLELLFDRFEASRINADELPENLEHLAALLASIVEVQPPLNA